MALSISGNVEAEPNSLDIQSDRTFDLSFMFDIDGNEDMADLSDEEIFDRVYPQALDCVQRAMSNITQSTRSRLDKRIPHTKTMVNLKGCSNRSSADGRFHQHHETKGSVFVNTYQPTNAGESWLVAFQSIAETAAKDLTVNVMIGLGREKAAHQWEQMLSVSKI